MARFLDQLYRTKLRFAGLITVVLGVGFLFLAKAVATTPTLNWLFGWPLSEVGTTLLSAGVIAVIFEYYARKEADERTAQQLRRAVRAEAPALRDAFIDTLAFQPEALNAVGSDELFDRIVVGALGHRLHDRDLAKDVYDRVHASLITSPERWRDLRVSVQLSRDSQAGDQTRPMFVATVRREYIVRPRTATVRFASTGDPDEYRDLLQDPTIAGQWYFQPNKRVEASDRAVFEVVQFAVDGIDRPIRRTERKGSQLYSVSLGKTAGEKEVTIAYTYRALVQQRGHLFYVDVPRPSKGVEVRFSYAGSGIRYVNTLDFLASTEQARVTTSPDALPDKSIVVTFRGQTWPRAGVVFVWSLDNE